MTVQPIDVMGNMFRFHGLSTDVKPESPHEGATFHAVDTGEQYVFFDGSWEPDLRMIYAVRQAGL